MQAALFQHLTTESACAQEAREQGSSGPRRGTTMERPGKIVHTCTLSTLLLRNSTCDRSLSTLESNLSIFEATCQAFSQAIAIELVLQHQPSWNPSQRGFCLLLAAVSSSHTSLEQSARKFTTSQFQQLASPGHMAPGAILRRIRWHCLQPLCLQPPRVSACNALPATSAPTCSSCSEKALALQETPLGPACKGAPRPVGYPAEAAISVPEASLKKTAWDP
jgi:hypothetical protein